MTAVTHLFVTQDFAPDLGGMARRHVELARRFPGMVVSTVGHPDAARVDAGQPWRVVRQPFPFSGAKTFVNQLRWARWLRHESAGGDVRMLHCGNLRPCGHPVWWASRRTGVPYLIYVNGLDLLRERAKTRGNPTKRLVTRAVFEDARGIVATSDFTGELTAEVMRDVGVRREPPVARIHLGTDPSWFHPGRDTRRLRARLGLGDAPLLVTIARLVPHKGQDTAIRALARLRARHPSLRYLVVGRGPDEARLRALAAELGVGDAVTFAGALPDDEVAEAYATATVYLGLSRREGEYEVEGFGISLVEAAASGAPSVAGRAGGVPSAVVEGKTGVLVDPTDVDAVAAAVGALLDDETRRAALGRTAREVAVSHYNWDRVARETEAFARRVAPEAFTG